MSYQLLVRGSALVIGFLCLFFGASVPAGARTLVDVDHVDYVWAPPPGDPDDYAVVLTRDGVHLDFFGIVTEPRVTIPVSAGDSFRVSVVGRRRRSDGTYAMSPWSALSDEIRVVRSPQLPGVGEWTLDCRLCPSVERRDLGDASRVLAEAPGLPAPWRVAGETVLRNGEVAMVWQDPTSGRIRLWYASDLVPVGGADAVGAQNARWVGTADFDDDDVDELVFYTTSQNLAEVWKIRSNGDLERLQTMSGPSGTTLAAVGDFTGLGLLDLLWHDDAAGTLVPTVLSKRLLSGVVPSPITRLSDTIYGLPPGARVVASDDFDANGHRDLLWRLEDGSLYVGYLVWGSLARVAAVPTTPDDRDLRVVGTAEIDWTPGADIALQNERTGDLSVALPLIESHAVRILTLTPGRRWLAASVGD